ncbi:MAG: cell envelope biogenesis protein OmpA [Flavobacteriaceae bacterium]|nr:cell envelope biogenesis protein OmpA [Flavobacteriaceae bacterium]
MADVQDDKLQLLREILLVDDREIASAVNQRLDLITETIEQREKLSKKVDPIIKERLDQFITEIPDTLGPTITKALQQQIENSKDQVVEALYPIMGKMIKRYVQNEIKKLSETINKKINNTFSMSSIKRKIKSRFTGVKESDLLLIEADPPLINEIFVIQKGSGILLGNLSETETLDKDMVSGMLTAIKSFVEDAFSGGAQNLEAIEYELYTIHIQNFFSYYIAVVVSGNYTRSFESKIENKLLGLSQKLSPKVSTLTREEIDRFLENFFDKWKWQKK